MTILDSFLTRRGEIEIINGLCAAGWGLALVADEDMLRLTPGLTDLGNIMPSWVWGMVFLGWAGLVYAAWYCRAWKCQRAGLFLGTIVWSALAAKMWTGLGHPELNVLAYIALAIGCVAAYLRLRFRPDSRADAFS